MPLTSIIDLRSDTKTLPTPVMRKAMYEAEVGDDVDGEDPTINRLEMLAAEMLGKEAAIFTPSGIMSNLLSVLTHTRPGDEIVLGSQSHIFWYEVGGASALGGVVMHTVPNEADGTIEPENLRMAIRGKDIDFPRTALLCLENTHNRCGGTVLPVEYTGSISALARRHGLKIHIDGARIFSAAVYLGVPVSRLTENADSVCFCLSKNLSAPVGSILCGSEGFIASARRWRRMLGGGMRQAGILAAAGIVALETMIERLAEDHANARRLAFGLAEIPGLSIQPERVQTNIVLFEPPADFPAEAFIMELKNRGIMLSYMGERKIRAVTHRMINSEDIETCLEHISSVAGGITGKQ
ncbi:MAG: low-specificity L-threonine aldolase [Dehalococcoidaceae bacterium]|nr:low-specificity L-threonine aldolase [Dehalococcoidaceae bacterium]